MRSREKREPPRTQAAGCVEPRLLGVRLRGVGHACVMRAKVREPRGALNLCSGPGAGRGEPKLRDAGPRYACARA
eukprot:scaffold72484_cov56-Phaeocystis_antarctica.AAC.4